MHMCAHIHIGLVRVHLRILHCFHVYCDGLGTCVLFCFRLNSFIFFVFSCDFNEFFAMFIDYVCVSYVFV